MKASIFFLFIFLVKFAFAQNKVEGISEFKVGYYTVNNLMEYAKNQKQKNVPFYKKYKDSYDNFLSKKIKVEEFGFDSTITYKHGDYNTHICPNVRYFRVKDIEVADIKFDLKLTFLNDTLYFIRTENYQKLFELFKLKYTDFASDTSYKEIKCEYKLTGNTKDNLESYKTYTWLNGDVKAVGHHNFYYNDKCESILTYYIEVWSKNALLRAEQCDMSTGERKAKENELFLKSKLIKSNL